MKFDDLWFESTPIPPSCTFIISSTRQKELDSLHHSIHLCTVSAMQHLEEDRKVSFEINPRVANLGSASGASFEVGRTTCL